MKVTERMRDVIPNYHHSCAFLSFLRVMILFTRAASIYVNSLSSTESLTISSNRTIVSTGDVFELGFFKITRNSGGDSWYLGIWYKDFPEKTYVWVANRDNPLPNSIGTLKISDANLVLLDQFDTPVWFTNLTKIVTSPVVAELLANGNFVLRDSKTKDPDELLWQSFDFPTDTLLPEMKLGRDLKTGRNRNLRSWRNVYDPSSGYLSLELETQGLPDLFIWTENVVGYRSGPWDGFQFAGIPEMRDWDDVVNNVIDTREEVTYTFRVTKPDSYQRLTMSSTGLLQLFAWYPNEWFLMWSSASDPCEVYQNCGSNSYTYCGPKPEPMCTCITGFDPMKLEEWAVGNGASGCVRRTRLGCGGDEFLQLKHMKLPDSRMTSVDRRIGLEECRERCLADCNCTAYANANLKNGGSGCVIWTEDLSDIQGYVRGGQDLYVRIAAADLGKKRNINGKIIGLITGIIIILLLSFIIFYVWKRKRNEPIAIVEPNVTPESSPDVTTEETVIPSNKTLPREDITERENRTEGLQIPSSEFEAVVKATDNFSDSNKLGEGGFGIVYKGKLTNGEEVAVKKLSEVSHQGNVEFTNEVKLISKLQHINLVRILGCCTYGKEKMLIYEYLENSSLDRHLFDKYRSSELIWRLRFDIANGIARGVVYLHHDSRCRIIHRDLKASNILLDKNMIPKISDFGMARIFSDDQHEALTRRIVGTYGYMSPEYAMDGVYSEKSDVFSFGVMLLEIVTSTRNSGFFDLDLDNNLLSYVWRNVEEGTGLQVVDQDIIDLPTFQADEVLRCIKIALLCVQEYAEDRPTMLSVVSMLGSDAKDIPKAIAPGYCVGREPYSSDSSSTSSKSSTWSSDDSSRSWTFGFTMTDIEPQ